MITIKVNERKPKEKDYPISKNVPNAETLRSMENTNKGIGLTKTKNHEHLLEKLYSWIYKNSIMEIIVINP